MKLAIRYILTATLAFGGVAAGHAAESPASLYAPASTCEVRRAGYPWRVGDWAQPNDTCDYDGYYVGGGACRYRTKGHCSQQGTWGWDYTGRFAPRIVALSWWHPPREQGGTGAYAPDGGPPCFEHSIPE
jgi:hypothetical protein